MITICGCQNFADEQVPSLCVRKNHGLFADMGRILVRGQFDHRTSDSGNYPRSVIICAVLQQKLNHVILFVTISQEWMDWKRDGTYAILISHEAPSVRVDGIQHRLDVHIGKLQKAFLEDTTSVAVCRQLEYVRANDAQEREPLWNHRVNQLLYNL